MKHAITYIPVNEIEKCQICKIYELIKFSRLELIIRKCEQHVVRGKNPELNGIVRGASGKVICFGHKHDEFPILLTCKEEFISADWFGEQFNTGIFFVRNGASLFEIPEYLNWIEKFKHWVAFNENFQPFAEYTDSFELQQQMYKDFFKELVDKQTGAEISNSLKKIYDKYIDKFSILYHHKDSDPKAITNTINVLQMNRESIVYGN
jgi:hypothetical protein